MISSTEFRHQVRDDNIRISQIIHLAMALGVLFFLVVTVVVANSAIPMEEPDDSLIELMCIVLALFAIGAYTAGIFLYNRGFAKLDLEKSAIAPNGEVFESVPDIFVERLRTIQIIRLATFEGVAFFGIVVCLLAALSGVIHTQPIYWLAALPALVVVVLVIATFPTKEKLVTLFEEYQTNTRVSSRL